MHVTRENIEFQEKLEKELRSASRWFYVSLTFFALCIGYAVELGSEKGWPWLCGALVCLLIALWTRIDEHHTRVMIEIHKNRVVSS